MRLTMKFIDNTRIPDQPYPELRKILKAFKVEDSAEISDCQACGFQNAGGFYDQKWR
jgi:hypothetical protein